MAERGGNGSVPGQKAEVSLPFHLRICSPASRTAAAVNIINVILRPAHKTAKRLKERALSSVGNLLLISAAGVAAATVPKCPFG